MNKKVFIALPLALMLTVGLTACGGNNQSGNGSNGGEPQIEYRDKDYVDVTAIGGTIKGQEYSHDKIVKGENVTVVAPAKLGTRNFIGWFDGNEKLSDQLEYEHTANASITLTAQYDNNTLSTWDGEYPETVNVQATTAADGGYVADFDAKTWHISSAAGLAYWAELVHCGKTGNSENGVGYKFSAFDQGIMGEDSSKFAEKFDEAYNPDNAWTLSLECDVDLDNQAWNPIWFYNGHLDGLTFDGNGHTISNLHAETKGRKFDGNYVDGSAGFFGTIQGCDFTIKNVTFDGAFITNDMDGADNADGSTEHPNGNRHCAVVVGFMNSGFVNAHRGRENVSIFENVHIKNAFVGGTAVTKSGLFIGRTGNGSDKSFFHFKNCTATDSTIIGFTSLGGLVGHAYHGDADMGLGGNISIFETECYMSNILAINISQAVNAAFGTLAEATNVAHEKDITRISLSITGTDDPTKWKPAGGAGYAGANANIAVTSDDLMHWLNNGNSAVETKNMVLVCRDMAITAEQLADVDDDSVVIYVLEGVKLDLPQDHGFTVYTFKTSEVDGSGHAAVYEGATKKGVFNNGLVLDAAGSED